MKGEEKGEGEGREIRTHPISLPLPRIRSRDSLWQHAVSMLVLKSRRTLRARVALNSVGISYTCVYRVPIAKSEGPAEVPRYGTVENRRGQGGGEHPLFRGGSLHGSAHPNSLHSLDPGGSRWFLAPPLPPSGHTLKN